MRRSFLIACVFCSLLSCSSKHENQQPAIQLLIADTTNNIKAQGDLTDMKHCEEIARQLGLKDLKQGADSFEIRVWYLNTLYYSENVTILKRYDSSIMLSYHQIYNRPVYNNFSRDPFRQPVIDSVASKTIRLQDSDLEDLNFDSIWSVASQCELDTLGKLGWFDCDLNMIEVADRQRYKFLSFTCPHSYYDTIKIRDIRLFLHYAGSLNAFANKYRLTPFRF